MRLRFAFIEAKILVEGCVRPKDLMDAFGLSRPQASRNLKDYKESCPDNIIYDTSLRFYVPTDSFTPHYLSSDPKGFLGTVRGLEWYLNE